MAEDPTPYLQDADDKIAKPVKCVECGSELDIDSNDTLLITSDSRPVCEEHRDAADAVCSLKRSHGYPWNGMHPETGETQQLESAVWFEIADKTNV